MPPDTPPTQTIMSVCKEPLPLPATWNFALWRTPPPDLNIPDDMGLQERNFHNDCVEKVNVKSTHVQLGKNTTTTWDLGNYNSARQQLLRDNILKLQLFVYTTCKILQPFGGDNFGEMHHFLRTTSVLKVATFYTYNLGTLKAQLVTKIPLLLSDQACINFWFYALLVISGGGGNGQGAERLFKLYLKYIRLISVDGFDVTLRSRFPKVVPPQVLQVVILQVATLKVVSCILQLGKLTSFKLEPPQSRKIYKSLVQQLERVTRGNWDNGSDRDKKQVTVPEQLVVMVQYCTHAVASVPAGVMEIVIEEHMRHFKDTERKNEQEKLAKDTGMDLAGSMVMPRASRIDPMRHIKLPKKPRQDTGFLLQPVWPILLILPTSPPHPSLVAPISQPLATTTTDATMTKIATIIVTSVISTAATMTIADPVNPSAVTTAGTHTTHPTAETETKISRTMTPYMPRPLWQSRHPGPPRFDLATDVVSNFFLSFFMPATMHHPIPSASEEDSTLLCPPGPLVPEKDDTSSCPPGSLPSASEDGDTSLRAPGLPSALEEDGILPCLPQTRLIDSKIIPNTAHCRSQTHPARKPAHSISLIQSCRLLLILGVSGLPKSSTLSRAALFELVLCVFRVASSWSPGIHCIPGLGSLISRLDPQTGPPGMCIQVSRVGREGPIPPQTHPSKYVASCTIAISLVPLPEKICVEGVAGGPKSCLKRRALEHI
ncbi:hypothetical protein GGX14DRAFT_398633 [Mycena pura]|uniref:Uncharacterized protein n=1 Tax=Mycena pura TaxID=153505 RepID=A0AAD6VA45_9AGAR|nr:hypothetical protein GGX14DRAFT_398633 [Mycena pura]